MSQFPRRERSHGRTPGLYNGRSPTAYEHAEADAIKHKREIMENDKAGKDPRLPRLRAVAASASTSALPCMGTEDVPPTKKL